MSEIVTIGDATLYHGDCLEILPTLPKVDAVITDPPYGIGWSKPHLMNGGGRLPSRAHSGIDNDEDCSVRDAALCFFVRGIVFGSFLAPMPASTKQVLIWHKPGDSGLFGTVAGYRRDHEPIFLYGSWPALPVKFSSVIRGAAEFRGRASEETNHPHCKPVDLMERLISQAGPFNHFCDPFMGSGTTGVACANLGRKFIGIEIERKYFDIACERIDNAYRQQRMFV